jgi:hypothetical protein
MHNSCSNYNKAKLIYIIEIAYIFTVEIKITPKHNQNSLKSKDFKYEIYQKVLNMKFITNNLLKSY